MKHSFKIVIAGLILCAFAFGMQGCAMFQRQPRYVLTESETYYFVPPNTPFKAQLVKDGPLVEVQRTQPSWLVDSGYLSKLQEAANAATLGLKDK